MSGACRIVVGIDESRHAGDAVGLAQALLGRRSGSLEVAYVHPLAVPRTAAEQYLHRCVQDLQVPAHVHALIGVSPAAALHELARNVSADLIVVGSTHHGTIGRVLLGDGGARTVHAAPCPVAVAPSGWRTARSIATIGVAFDGSRESRQALTWAEPVARGCSARLRLIHVIPPSAATEDARALLAPALSLLGDRGDAEIRLGGTVEQLRRASEGVDLLVVGSRRRGPLRRVLAGSTSMGLLRDADCPVIIVPRPAHD